MENKKLIAAFVGTLMIANAILVVPAALADEKGLNQKGLMLGQNFCAKVDHELIKTDKEDTVKLTFLQEKRAASEARRAKNKAELDKRKADNRADRDAKLDEKEVKVAENTNLTDAQKTAVATYNTTVEAALKARRDAVDAATKTFRDAVDKLQTAHSTSVDSVKKAHDNAVEAALTKAQADCKAGVAAETVKANMKTALEKARETFVSTKQDVAKLGPEIAALTKTRNAALEKARETFQAAIEKAKADLKTGLGK